MKVTVNNTEQKQEKPFPKLMVSSKNEVNPNMIVLMIEPNKGTIISNPSFNNECVGEFRGFGKGLFTDFNGSITLSND